MPELIEAYWPFLLAAVLIGLLVAWIVLVANRKTTIVGEEKKDVLDEGAERAKRNQALIDAPSGTAASPGPVSAAANSDQVAAAVADADAEAGATVAPSTPPPAPTREPAPKPEPAPAQTPPPGGDDLTVIKGLGPKIATLLNSLGVTTYRQIAEWDEAEIDRIDSQLDRFQGRIRRDNWVEQAKLLSSGDKSAFIEKFGQNG